MSETILSYGGPLAVLVAWLIAVSTILVNWVDDEVRPRLKALFAAVVTSVGKGIITSRIQGLGTEPRYGQWGTGAGIAAIGDIAMFAEGTEARVAGTSSRVQTNVPNDTYRLVFTQTASAAKTITEVAQFDAATAGSLFSHADHAGQPLNANDGIQYTLSTVFS